MALVFNCPYCMGQNFVALERLKIKGSPVKCWLCGREIPWELLEELSLRNERRRSGAGGKDHKNFFSPP